MYRPRRSSAARPMFRAQRRCGWMVLPMSTASAPIRWYQRQSLIMSLACVLDDAAADDAVRLLVEQQLAEALCRGCWRWHGLRPSRGTGPFTFRQCALASSSVTPHPGQFPDRVGHARDHARVEGGLLPPRLLAATCASCTALCASIGWLTMSPMAKMWACWCASARPLMKLRSPTITLAFGGDLLLLFGVRPDGLQHEVVEAAVRFGACPGPGTSCAGMPSLVASGADRPGLEHQTVEAVRVHLRQTLTRSRVGALHQAVEHLDDVELGAQGRNTLPIPGR